MVEASTAEQVIEVSGGSILSPAGFSAAGIHTKVKRKRKDLHKIVQAIQPGLSILPGFGHDFITGVTAGQVAFVNQFLFVAGVVVQGCLGQANAARDITQGRGPGSLKIK